MTKAAVALTLAFGLTCATGLAHAENMKIGYVDLQRVLNDTDEGKRVKNQLKSIFKSKQGLLDKRQTELKKLKEDFDKQRVVLKPDALRQKEQELQKKFIELQGLYMSLQKEISGKEAEMMQGMLKRTQGILADIGKKEGFTLILQRGESVLWGKPHLDITNEVIRAFNQGGKGKKR
jgi:outer membrane protein